MDKNKIIDLSYVGIPLTVDLGFEIDQNSITELNNYNARTLGASNKFNPIKPAPIKIAVGDRISIKVILEILTWIENKQLEANHRENRKGHASDSLANLYQKQQNSSITNQLLNLKGGLMQIYNWYKHNQEFIN